MSDTAAVIAQFKATFLEWAPEKLVELIAAEREPHAYAGRKDVEALQQGKRP